MPQTAAGDDNVNGEEGDGGVQEWVAQWLHVQCALKGGRGEAGGSCSRCCGGEVFYLFYTVR